MPADTRTQLDGVALSGPGWGASRSRRRRRSARSCWMQSPSSTAAVSSAFNNFRVPVLIITAPRSSAHASVVAFVFLSALARRGAVLPEQEPGDEADEEREFDRGEFVALHDPRKSLGWSVGGTLRQAMAWTRAAWRTQPVRVGTYAADQRRRRREGSPVSARRGRTDSPELLLPGPTFSVIQNILNYL